KESNSKRNQTPLCSLPTCLPRYPCRWHGSALAFRILTFRMTSSVHAKKALGVAFVLALALIGSSCGDVYRPVAQVIPGTPPNPGAVHFVITLSTNGGADPGTADHVDVSGDSSLGAFQTGFMPVHAALTANASRLYVANLADDTITANITSSPTSASV